MNLRKKLFTLFGSLSLLALASGGVTGWAIAQWGNSEDKLQEHYHRSLLVLDVKSKTFRAVKELLDEIVEEDEHAREDFEEVLAPVEGLLRRWEDLAHNESERRQVHEVRDAYGNLVRDARAIFDLMAAGQKEAAIDLIENDLEEINFPTFERVTVEAVESDLRNREIILAETRRTRQTAQFVLMISAFGILSLVLLLAAYLSADLFTPLKETESALNGVTRGDFKLRLDEERTDELGAINRAFNRMMESILNREHMMELASEKIIPNDIQGLLDKPDWNDAPSRLTLHTLVSQLRSQVSQLSKDDVQGGDTVAVIQKNTLLEQVDTLLQVVMRVTEFGFPLDLNLALTDIRALLHEILLRFHDEFINRNISFELCLTPQVDNAVVDRLKLREALGELIRNALAALPEKGGHLGIRATLDTQTAKSPELLIEVADDGTGIERPLIERAMANAKKSSNQRPNVGLKLTKAIIEQHGGSLNINSAPSVGTMVQVRLPCRQA
ncbi:MAG: ATP-binding protein [Leptolyngbyaceae cyanobacterium MO_188.B28]|nr:ATP-binding protein [Leptolyngbyaceae cyanobacterium MO_188.B28]